MSSENPRLGALRQAFEKDSDGESFFALASALVDEKQGRREFRELCLQRITRQPSDLKARLLYAKALYLDGYLEFSIRELLELRRRKQSPSLDALINSFGPLAADFGHHHSHGAHSEEKEEELTAEALDETLGEIDFDLGILDEED